MPQYCYVLFGGNYLILHLELICRHFAETKKERKSPDLQGFSYFPRSGKLRTAAQLAFCQRQVFFGLLVVWP